MTTRLAKKKDAPRAGLHDRFAAWKDAKGSHASSNKAPSDAAKPAVSPAAPKKPSPPSTKSGASFRTRVVSSLKEFFLKEESAKKPQSANPVSSVAVTPVPVAATKVDGAKENSRGAKGNISPNSSSPAAPPKPAKGVKAEAVAPPEKISSNKKPISVPVSEPVSSPKPSSSVSVASGPAAPAKMAPGTAAPAKRSFGSAISGLAGKATSLFAKKPAVQNAYDSAVARDAAGEKRSGTPRNVGDAKNGVSSEEGARATHKNDEDAMRRARERLQQQKRKKKSEHRTEQQRRHILADLIVKAGHRIHPDKLQRAVFYITLIVIALCTFLTLLIASASGKSAGGLLLFYFGLWTGVFAFVYLFTWMVIYLYLDIRIYNRTKELEEVLPDFLQLASANISAGMPIDRALWFAVRPNFGVLAKEIEEVAKATLAGEELNTSLLRFTEKYESPTLRRSINILLEGLAAGGEIADLLNKIALDIQETKILKKEMSANVTTYAIFITFASIVMAPLLFALATELLTIIVKITSSLDLGSSGGSFLTLNIKTTPEMISNFKWFSIVMLSVTAVMSASIVSVIRKGKVKDGIRNLPIFVATSLIIYYLSTLMLHSLLANFI